MRPGTFSFRMNVPAEQEGTGRQVNIPVDAVVMSQTAQPGDLPLLVEAKSAGDFTNVNKRRKEEAVKMSQLRQSHGEDVRFILFLCGYFDSGYLDYEAAEGIFTPTGSYSSRQSASNAPSTAVKARWRTAGTMMGMLFRAVKWDAMRSPGAGRKVKMRLPRL